MNMNEKKWKYGKPVSNSAALNINNFFLKSI
jgi:hypothetical protein